VPRPGPYRAPPPRWGHGETGPRARPRVDSRALGAPNIVSRASERNPLPEGTISVGAGLVIAGLSAYGFLSLASRSLGENAFAPLSLLWFTTFILAPGFFLPVEQEVGRALAHRRALGQGGLPVVRKAGVLALGLVAVISAIILVLSPILAENLFEGSYALVLCLLLSFIGYAAVHFTRGVLSGSGRFLPYGMVMATEGVVRVAGAAALVVAGVEAVWAFGLMVGIPPFVALAVGLRGQRRRLEPGPAASWSELTPNLGWLLLGSAMAAALVNAGPLAANRLATEDQEDLVANFAAGVLVARVPLFLFQAVQAALLPKLARLAAQGMFEEFRRGFRMLLVSVLTVGGLGVVGAFLVGPWAVQVFFDAELSRRTLTLLALASALYMIAVALAQALIALHAHARVALGWTIAMVAFLVATAADQTTDVLLRVELALLAGSVAALLVFGLSLRPRVARAEGVTEESVIEAMYDLPIEP
jgi:O-antigen/teichoic acid export membrane protein